ncbi:MAG: aspartate aminotransferase family protein [Ignavibacteriae bacterium]|nr:aspartate aminotransferase family protein [Ignavibacteriota bacterium]
MDNLTNNITYHVNTYKRFPVEFVKGEGAYLFDKDGNKYLDFLSGIAVTGFGHNHPELIKAAKTQIENLWHVSNLFIASPQEELAKKLTSISKLDKVFFCNSGTEANEAAIKFVRKWGKGRSAIITAEGGFHGRTMGSLSASAQEKLWEGFHPLTPGFVSVPYNNINAIQNKIDETTVAVLIEPIQGENGIIIPDKDYLQNIRTICDENNLLMIVDEIQTGIGRTGKYFDHQYSNIKPDIITVAKGIANGLPLGATICSDKVDEAITPGSHGSTFGGNPVSVAVANKVMDLLSEETLSNISKQGKLIIKNLIDENFNSVIEIRSKGLIIGIEFNQEVDVKVLASKLLQNKIVVGTAGNNVLRLLPPFIIDNNQINKFIETLKIVLETSFNN